ncbi:MAG: PorV/PorQ family protein [bacterium]
MNKILLFASGFCIFSTAHSQNANLGTVGAQFLQINVGAEAVGMGGAYVAKAENAGALFWNPAGIANLERQSVYFAHTPWRATIALNSAAYALPVNGFGSLGAAVTVLSMDRMEVTNEYAQDGTGEYFDAQDLMISLSYARALSDRFSTGLTAKYIQQKIWNETASGVAFDVGTQYRLWFSNAVVGMSLTNFGGDLRMEGRDLSYQFDTDPNAPDNRPAPANLEAEAYPLPLHFQVGLVMDVLRSGNFAWQIASEVTHPNDNSERVNFGTQLGILDRLFLRGGYRYNYDDEDLSAGVGLSWPMSTNQLQIDYAFARHDLLPDVHRFAVGFQF